MEDCDVFVGSVRVKVLVGDIRSQMECSLVISVDPGRRFVDVSSLILTGMVSGRLRRRALEMSWRAGEALVFRVMQFERLRYLIFVIDDSRSSFDDVVVRALVAANAKPDCRVVSIPLARAGMESRVLDDLRLGAMLAQARDGVERFYRTHPFTPIREVRFIHFGGAPARAAFNALRVAAHRN